jgi:hypothetical protein
MTRNEMTLVPGSFSLNSSDSRNNKVITMTSVLLVIISLRESGTVTSTPIRVLFY